MPLWNYVQKNGIIWVYSSGKECRYKFDLLLTLGIKI
jgi:hypothetical protein